MSGGPPFRTGSADTPPCSHRVIENLLRSAHTLSRRRRQLGDLPQYAGKHPPRQMALRQPQPIVPCMLDQPSAGFHQSLLKLVGDQVGPHRRHQPPPLILEVVGRSGQAQRHFVGESDRHELTCLSPIRAL